MDVNKEENDQLGRCRAQTELGHCKGMTGWLLQIGREGFELHFEQKSSQPVKIPVFQVVRATLVSAKL